MKKYYLPLFLYLLPLCALAQSDQHYTMFMYNKLLYNPAYAGSRELTAINSQLRAQWVGIESGIRSANISVDAPVGTYMKPFRKVAVGLSVADEKYDIERNTDFKSYYAYRIKQENSVISLGLSAGINLYSFTPVGNVFLRDPNDPSFAENIYNTILPNFGTGVYWSGDKFFLGLSVPNLLQNKYIENEPKTNVKPARQIRTYYLSGGYMYALNDIITLKPQAIIRYARNAKYSLPLSADLNLSATAYDRIMAGITFRTDKSIGFMLQMQVSVRFNMGYSYDYLMSDLAPNSRGAHELVLGYEFNHERLKFAAPRFTKEF